MRRASAVFSQRLTQRGHVEHRLGQELLELAVLLASSAFGRRASETSMPPKRRAPRVERRVADPVAAADLSYRQPSLLLLQEPMICSSLNRLFFIVRLLLDGPSLQNEGRPGGKVTRAAQQEKAGNLSAADRKKVDAKADKVLGDNEGAAPEYGRAIGSRAPGSVPVVVG